MTILSIHSLQTRFLLSSAVANQYKKHSLFALFSTITSLLPLRKSLRFFFKLVHPDLTSNIPDIAIAANQASLSQLNAYIDQVEKNDQEHESQYGASSTIPQTTLQFFKPYVSRSGYQLLNRVQPISLILPGLRSDATFLERLAIKAKLLENAQQTIQPANMGFSVEPPIPAIFTPKYATEEALTRLWQEDLEQELFMSSLYPQFNSPAGRAFNEREELRVECFERHVNAGWSQATKGGNTKKIVKRVHKLYKKARERTERRYGPPETEEQLEMKRKAQEDHSDALRLRQLGFHPELVLFDTKLTDEEANEARSRLLGKHLIEKSDIWLMHNIWKTLRQKPTPIPVVVTNREVNCSSMSSKDANNYTHEYHKNCFHPESKNKSSDENGRHFGNKECFHCGDNDASISLIRINASASKGSSSTNASDVNSRLQYWKSLGYECDFTLGFLHIPVRFDIWKLADFLEEFLNELRESRENVGSANIAQAMEPFQVPFKKSVQLKNTRAVVVVVKHLNG